MQLIKPLMRMHQDGTTLRLYWNWKEQEVKTLVDVATLDRRFEMSKKKKYNGTGRKYSNRKEIVPDWLYKDDESTNPEGERKTVQSIDEERERLQEVLNKYKS